MSQDRLKKIPTSKTIARHYSEGKYCDYPADIIFSAVNSHDFEYNSIAIPIKLGFPQIFEADFNAFMYIAENKDQIDSFLEDPNGFMAEQGIELATPLDEYAPKIMAALAEDEMLAALKSEDKLKIFDMFRTDEGKAWRDRHPERYPKAYLNRKVFFRLDGIPYYRNKEYYQSLGFSQSMYIAMIPVLDFFAEE